MPEPTAVVLDLDGVLADVRHRLHHLAGRPRDWDAFFAAAPRDPVLEPGRQRALRAACEGHAVVYLTGRPERCRADTLDWLVGHGLPEGPLFMRRDDDRRPARITKVVLLRRLCARLDVVAVVDDDLAVVAAVRAAGFHVEHATWMSDISTSTSTSPSTSGSGLNLAEHAGSDQAVLFEVQESEGRT